MKIKKLTLFWFSIMVLFVGIVIGAASVSKRYEQCVPDPTFHRIECCNKLSANGRCAIGQTVQLYNI